MLVRVKESLVENFYGFYGFKRRYPGDEFEIVAKKDKAGKTVTVNSQFSDKWMEKVNKGKYREEVEDDSLASDMSLS